MLGRGWGWGWGRGGGWGRGFNGGVSVCFDGVEKVVDFDDVEMDVCLLFFDYEGVILDFIVYFFKFKVEEVVNRDVIFILFGFVSRFLKFYGFDLNIDLDENGEIVFVIDELVVKEEEE